MALVASKNKASKAYTIRIYLGYGVAGARIHSALFQEAHRKQVKISKFVMAALKKAYPKLSL